MARGRFHDNLKDVWVLGPLLAVAVALVLVVVALMSSGNRTPPAFDAEAAAAAEARAEAEDQAAEQSRAAAAPKTVAFLGDSYTGGSKMDSGEAARWPAIVSPRLNWIPSYFTVGGSGYIHPGQDEPFGARVDAVIAAHPDIVVVAGGINDAQRYDPADTGAAALDVFQRLRAGLPDTDLVVIGPFFPTSPAPQKTLDTRQAIQDAAANVGAPFIDPLPWFADDAVEIGSDDTHPTDAGHAAIATQMEPALRDLGFGPPQP